MINTNTCITNFMRNMVLSGMIGIKMVFITPLNLNGKVISNVSILTNGKSLLNHLKVNGTNI